MTSRAPTGSGTTDTVTVLYMAVLAILLGTAFQSCLAWVLGPEGRGSLAVCLTFTSIMGVVFTFGTERAIQYHLTARRLTVAQATLSLLLTIALGSIIAAGLGWLLIDSTIQFFDKAEPDVFRYSLVLIPILTLNGGLTFLLGARRRFAYRGVATLIDMGIRLVLIASLIGILGFGVGGAIFAISVGAFVGIVLNLAGLWHEVGSERIRFPWAEWRSVLSYSARYYAARLGWVVNAQIGLIILGLMGSRAQIGFFATAAALSARLLVVSDSVGAALLPRIGVAKHDSTALVAKVSRFSTALVGGGLILLLLSSGVVIPFLFSPDFSPVIPLLWLLAPGILAQASGKPLRIYFTGTNRPGIESLATGVNLTVNAVVLPGLYPFLGMHAAAAAASLGHVTAFGVLAVAFLRDSKLSGQEFWKWRSSDSEAACKAVRSFF